MHVLVGIEVCRSGAHQSAKRFELIQDFRSDCVPVVGWHDRIEQDPLLITIRPLAKVDVQADAEVRIGAGVFRRRARIWPPDHEAGAGEDPSFVAADDALVDARGLAKIVCVDDQTPRVRVCCPLHVSARRRVNELRQYPTGVKVVFGNLSRLATMEFVSTVDFVDASDGFLGRAERHHTTA